jgi:hypothetical protein
MSKVIDLDKNHQISCTVPGGVYLQILDMANDQKRSISQMGSILLEKAVKEKTRNRKGAKKDNS